MIENQGNSNNQHWCAGAFCRVYENYTLMKEQLQKPGTILNPVEVSDNVV